MKESSLKKYFPELVFMAALFCVYWLWARTIPFNEAPDEYMKWDLIHYISKTGIYPAGYDPAIVSNLYGNSYAFEPALVYITDALFVKLWSLSAADTGTYYMAARLLSVIISCGTVFILFRIGGKLFSKKITWLFVCFIALLPQYTFLSSYINNDIFGIFCGSLIVYFCICGTKSAWALRDCLGLSIGVGLCLLSYYYAYPMIAAALVYFVMSSLVFAKRDRGIAAKKYAKNIALFFLVVFAVAGWYFIRNLVLYNGDLFAMEASRLCAEKNAIPSMRPSVRITPENTDVGMGYMLFKMGWLKYSAVSFFGVFGYMKVFVAEWMYTLFFAVFSFFCLLGLRIKRWMAAETEWKLFTVTFAAAVAGVIAMSMFYSYNDDFQPQGRYLMQALIPIALLFCMGAEKVGEALGKKTGFPMHAALIVLFAVLNGISFFYLRNAYV